MMKLLLSLLVVCVACRGGMNADFPDSAVSDLAERDADASGDADDPGGDAGGSLDGGASSDAATPLPPDAVTDHPLGEVIACSTSHIPDPSSPIRCDCIAREGWDAGVCVGGRGAAILNRCLLHGWLILDPTGYPSNASHCASLATCLELERRYQASQNIEAPRCIYQDGTPIRTGRVGRATCPAGSEGVLCGLGCAPCPAPHNHCWGSSELDPLGFCVEDSMPCTEEIPCPDGWHCVFPRNLDVVGRPAAGYCTESRCAEIEALAPRRFRCGS